MNGLEQAGQRAGWTLMGGLLEGWLRAWLGKSPDIQSWTWQLAGVQLESIQPNAWAQLMMGQAGEVRSKLVSQKAACLTLLHQVHDAEGRLLLVVEARWRRIDAEGKAWPCQGSADLMASLVAWAE